MHNARLKGAILVLSGPSGAGKSSLYKILAQEFPHHYFSISSTTRPMREGEKDGVHYHFLSLEDFITQRDRGEFLEWAQVHGNFYGTSKTQVLNALKDDKLVIFDIDVQGQKNIKNAFPNQTTSVFVTTPNKKTLQMRLESRGSDTQAMIQERLSNATQEIQNLQSFDYLIINHNLEESAKQLVCIAKSVYLKSSLFCLDSLLEQWES